MALYLFPTLFVLVSLVLCWIAGPVFHLQGAGLVLFRCSVLLLGFLAAACVFWLWSLRRPKTGSTQSSAEMSELTALLREAEQRLAGAQRATAQSLHTLPLLYVIGTSNSAKTTTILKSGLDPELLAGQAYQDDAIAPTRLANIWYAQGALLVDVGEALACGSPLWPSLGNALMRRTRPNLLLSVFGKKRPLRSAVVCVSSESFFGANAAESTARLGREANAMLRQIADHLGSELPVYVLLTKLDRVPGFAEYVRNLNHTEAAERLGVLLPSDAFAQGVYAERASAVLSSALDRLFFSLGEFRLEVLGRESTAASTPLIYQFPRELQKLRNNLASYLVELARPSHLHVSPSLRGLFCVGVRAQVVKQAISAPAAMPRRTDREGAATGILSLQQIESAQAPSEAAASVTRRVAQWCFLPRLFPDVFLKPEELEAAAAAGSRVSLVRRLVLAGASVLLLAWIVCLTLSFRNNARLESSIREAAASLPANASPVALAPANQLARLDQLRQSLLQLQQFQRGGAPLMFRWGLYRGDALIGPATQLYFERFRWLLLTSTQSNLRKTLGSLPASAPADADYHAAYNPLRAYLITTSYHQYSAADFLAPVLVRFWLDGQTAESSQQLQLADQQFRFYSEQLRAAQLYDLLPSTPVVTHARGYLNSFGSFDRVYQNILAAASQGTAPIDFNRMFPGSAATVVEAHVVPGAFSRDGFLFVQRALEHPDQYFAGEAWVLGEQASLATQGLELGQKLSARYLADFREQWLLYLHAATVVRYRSLADARAKLGSLSAPNSALLALFATASSNTAAPGGSLAKQFQPTQALVPPNLKDRLIGPTNTTYMNSLVGLQGAVSQFTQDVSAANNPAAAQGVIAAAVSAHAAVSQTAQAFDIDAQSHVEQTVTRLLQEPITAVEDAVRGAAPEQINLAGRAFCSNAASVLAKFPFDRNATLEATPAEVTSVLKPGTGLLWQFYETSLKPLLVQQGGRWTASPVATLKPTAQFVQFFNRVAGLSDILFANGAASPNLNFDVHIPPSPGIQSVTLALDSHRLAGTDVSTHFTWSPQTAQQAQLIASYGSNNLPLQFSGPWSLFHLIDRGRVEQAANPVRLAYPLEISGTPIVVNGTPLTERLELSGPAASILAPGSLAGLRCVAQVAH